MGVAAGLLVLASAAFACTDFRGQMTISGNGAGNLSSTVVGGGGAGMTWCGTGTPTPSPIQTNVQSGQSNGSLTVAIAVAPSSSGCYDSGNNKMPNVSGPTNTWNVGIAGPTSGLTIAGGFPTGVYDSCGTHGAGSVTDMGNIVINNGVSSVTTINATNNKYWNGTGQYTVCVYRNDQTPAIGMIMNAV